MILSEVVLYMEEGVEGGPSQGDGPGSIFNCGQMPIFTIAEGPWPNTTEKARVSFNVHNHQRSLCNDHRSLLNTAGVWGTL